ncbi:MAG: 4-hydroxy-3-methylbut-2-enyl diphosphate reductase [Bacteroidaceae bacterium]|jgi:4-hydroxy-3-methylbut-2-enyl diphosphate reductase|nr:4-hydroxy-3-methylbut-2-enyl diphosphate reductase [Bacteroidaceae bacterium]
MTIEIDSSSGFCHGVTRAIGKAEEELAKEELLYCLGDIVHNGKECDRLQQLGLVTINHEQMRDIHDAKVLLRAHGEPPSTYALAREHSINLIDATCPVVLHLQERIKKEYDEKVKGSNGEKVKEKQIVIFGKKGHAEVIGLVGQTEETAIIIESADDAGKLDFNRDICLYSQTTMPLDEFRKIVEYVEQHISPNATFTYYDTICRQVANRMPNIRNFALRHDAVLFVCGKKSSNGRVLFNKCLEANSRSYMIDTASEIDVRWLQGCESIGICGATSTPKWLMEECKVRVEQLLGSHK